MPFHSPHFSCFPATLPRASPRGSSLHLPHCSVPLQSRGRRIPSWGLTPTSLARRSDTNFGPWVVPQSHLRCLLPRTTPNARARNKQCNSVTSTVSAPVFYLSSVMSCAASALCVPLRLRYWTSFPASIEILLIRVCVACTCTSHGRLLCHIQYHTYMSAGSACRAHFIHM
jgi:hypothetical protein